MKRSQIITLTAFVALSALIYFPLKSNQKETPKSIKQENVTIYVDAKEVENVPHTMNYVSYGQISPNKEVNVAFKVQGKLLKGTKQLKPGIRFKKGELLYSLEHLDQTFAFAARKANFSNLIVSALPDIELDFPSELKKWEAYNRSIGSGPIPELPKISSEREKMFLNARNIIPEYYSLCSIEIQLNDYDYKAPFTGTVVEVYQEPGSIISPGVQIAKIAQTGNYEIKVPIDVEDLEVYQQESNAYFINSDNDTIGTGKILRVSDVINQQTQSADVYYSVEPYTSVKIYNGLFVNVSIDVEQTLKSVKLPQTAVKNGYVNVLNGEQVTSVPVTIESEIPNYVFVTGLADGTVVLVDRLGAINSQAIYKRVNANESK